MAVTLIQEVSKWHMALRHSLVEKSIKRGSTKVLVYKWLSICKKYITIQCSCEFVEDFGVKLPIVKNNSNHPLWHTSGTITSCASGIL